PAPTTPSLPDALPIPYPDETASDRDLPEPRKDSVLDSAAEGTAAHEHAFDPQRVGPCLGKGHADQSVVAEAVTDLDGEAFHLAQIGRAHVWNSSHEWI